MQWSWACPATSAFRCSSELFLNALSRLTVFYFLNNFPVSSTVRQVWPHSQLRGQGHSRCSCISNPLVQSSRRCDLEAVILHQCCFQIPRALREPSVQRCCWRSLKCFVANRADRKQTKAPLNDWTFFHTSCSSTGLTCFHRNSTSLMSRRRYPSFTTSFPWQLVQPAKLWLGRSDSCQTSVCCSLWLAWDWASVAAGIRWCCSFLFHECVSAWMKGLPADPRIDGRRQAANKRGRETAM